MPTGFARTYNDAMYEALGNRGLTGQLNDRLIAWLASNGFTTGTIEDRLKGFLGGSGTIEDRWTSFLANLGYNDGTVTDSIHRYFENSSVGRFDGFATYVPDAYVYMHAKDLVGVIDDGQPVTTWLNRGSRTGNPTNTGSNRPTFRLTGVNGMPSVQFVATNSQFLIFDIADIVQPFIAVGLIRSTQTSLSQRWLGRGSSATAGGIGYGASNTYAGNFGTSVDRKSVV